MLLTCFTSVWVLVAALVQSDVQKVYSLTIFTAVYFIFFYLLFYESFIRINLVNLWYFVVFLFWHYAHGLQFAKFAVSRFLLGVLMTIVCCLHQLNHSHFQVLHCFFISTKSGSSRWTSAATGTVSGRYHYLMYKQSQPLVSLLFRLRLSLKPRDLLNSHK
jgi:hypothetical protein